MMPRPLINSLTILTRALCARTVGATLKSPEELISEGRAAYHAADFNHAAKALMGATLRRPGSHEAFLNYGHALRRLEHHDLALQAYQEALELDPRSAAAALGVALTYLRIGLDALARPYLEQAVELDRPATLACYELRTLCPETSTAARRVKRRHNNPAQLRLFNYEALQATNNEKKR